ncbi:MAG: sigma-54-dependent Fis family transcriptional regulator [Deltaproteobacteria bacterium]|nr:sigma-54-dependent Fis family transcriptional regulator [Deltaproteobacteria bacterium]
MISFTVYVVDDEKIIRDAVCMALKKIYRVKPFASAEDVLDEMERMPPDMVLLDIGLPGMNGIEALQEIKRLYPEVIVIMITAFEDVDTVVSAMKLGAHDYVVKPLNIDGLKKTIGNALDTIKMRKEIQHLQEKYLKENMPCFIGESDVIQDVTEVVKKVAQSADTPVLIIGETGTGKELLAGAIHYRSPNFNGPLVSLNCAAIPKELVESELFGYEKGAFTGADASGKIGMVEKAAEGTLFLDEVGDLSPEAQAKLLRFLEDNEYYRVGSTKKRHVRTRIVSATNRNLEHMIEDGLFRRDLFYRLAVVRIEVPSLNDRKDDILPMSRLFLMEFSQKFGKTFSDIAPDARRALESHPWKGNVRELRNIIERGVLIGNGPLLTLKEIGLDGSDGSKAFHGTGRTVDGKSAMHRPPIPDSGLDLADLLKSLETHYFQESLNMTKGNESKAAKLLHLSRDTFRYRRKKLHMK